MDDGPNASDSAPASLFHPGDVIGGRFTLRSELGKSRAAVWLADQTANPSWPKSVTLKLITNPSTEDASRLKEEHRICSLEALKDLACIPTSFEYGECTVRGVRVVYMVREFVDGQNILKHANEKGLTIEARVELMIKVCEGVGTLHHEGIGHRDLKPQNILVDTKGQPKLIDLGSAIDPARREKVNPTIVTEAFHWSPGYEPPEADGDDPVGAFHNGYRQWDVYSLGSVLADLLSGIRDRHRAPPKTKPVVEHDMELHDTLRHMAESLTDAERDAAATARGCVSVQAWFDAFDPLLELVSLKSRHDSLSERYESAKVLTAHLRDWLAAPRERRMATRPLRLDKRARAAAIFEWTRYASLITGVGSLIRENNHTHARRLIAEIPQIARNSSGAHGRYTETWEYRYYYGVLNSISIEFQHTSSPAFSPDGTRVVTVSDDWTARIWDAAAGELKAELNGHTAQVVSAIFSPDGTRVVTASIDTTARVWDAGTGEPRAELKGHTAPVTSATFSSDGTRVVTASTDTTARVWDAATGELKAELKGHTNLVKSAFFSPRGTKIVTASLDTTARIWESYTGAMKAELKGHTERVWSARFCPEGTRVVTASRDKTARIWDAATGELKAKLKGHKSDVHSAVFSPDGTRVVTASDDWTARIWDAATGKLKAELKGHKSNVRSAVFSPDGTRVVTASDDWTARIWDAATGGLEAELRGHANLVWEAAFSPDGTRVVTASHDRTVRVWEGSDSDIVRGHSWKRLVNLSESTIAFTDCYSQILIDVSFDHQHQTWNMAGARLVQAHTGKTTANFSPDGTRFVMPRFETDDALVRDRSTETIVAELKGHTAQVVSATFSSDGTRVVTASFDTTARVWDAATGELKAELKGHTMGLVSAVFSPDGTRVVTASYDYTARIWDAATGGLEAELRGHTNLVWAAAFSPDPDGTRVVTASGDSTVRVWDSLTGSELATLHHETARDAVFSRDGKRIFAVSENHGVRIWHTQLARERAANRRGNEIRATAQTVLHAANARWVGRASGQPSIEEIVRESKNDPLCTPEVLTEVERMLRDRQRST